MLAILGGFGAALCWAAAALAVSRSARRIGPSSTLAWVMLIGLVAALPGVVLFGGDIALGPTELGLLVTSGISNVVGLLLVYAALRTGKVAIVAPIVATEGAIGAAISVAGGELVAASLIAVLAVVVVGVVLASADRSQRDESGEASGRVILLALAAALCFGINLYVTGRIGTELPVAWAILPARLAGVLGVALPLIVMRRIRLTRTAAPFVLVTGVAEVAGTAAFAIGARDGIAVTSVISSQFGAIAAVGALVLFRERLSRLQLTGVATIAVGVAVLSALRA